MSSEHQIQRRVQRLRLLIIAAVAAVFAVALSPQLALAHDQLVENAPADNEVLSESPEEVVLRYNNSVLDIGEGATIVRVTDAAGVSVVDGIPEISGPYVTQALSELEDGAYRVTWRVVSSDGHPISGTFLFGVGEGAEDAIAAMPPIGETSEDGAETQQADASESDSTSFATPIIIGVAAVIIIVVTILLTKRRAAGPPTGN